MAIRLVTILKGILFVEVDKLRRNTSELPRPILQCAACRPDKTFLTAGHLGDILNPEVVHELIKRMLRDFQNGQLVQ